MIYQHPLAYLLGVEGVALLRAFIGEYDRAFMEERVAEIRRLLDSPALAGEGVLVRRLDTVDAYRVWSKTYDEPRNGLFDIDEPVVHQILDSLPPGPALDAACGTGRYAEYLASRGHRVIGVDSSPDMLARAGARVPDGDFRLGDLHRLPLDDDDQVDVVVCALALTHVPALPPIFAEFARVLRPGGHLVISDVHHALADLGALAKVVTPDGEPALLPVYRHRATDYINAALPLGLQVRRCEEPRIGADVGDPPAPEGSPEEITIGPWDDWPWSLSGIVPAAAGAAGRGTPPTIIWHFQLAASP